MSTKQALIFGLVFALVFSGLNLFIQPKKEDGVMLVSNQRVAHTKPDRRENYLQQADSSGQTYWQVTAIDTLWSDWYDNHPIITAYLFAADTTTGANGDSLAGSYVYQTAPVKNDGTVDTDVISDDLTLAFTTADDSVGQKWMITNSAVGSGTKFRFGIRSTAANDKDAGSLHKIQIDLSGGE